MLNEEVIACYGNNFDHDSIVKYTKVLTLKNHEIMKTTGNYPILISLALFMVMMTTVQAGNSGLNPNGRAYPAGTSEQTPFIRHHSGPNMADSDFNTKSEFYITPGTIIVDPFNLIISEINGRDVMVVPVINSSIDQVMNQQLPVLRPGNYRIRLINPNGGIKYDSFYRVN